MTPAHPRQTHPHGAPGRPGYPSAHPGPYARTCQPGRAMRLTACTVAQNGVPAHQARPRWFRRAAVAPCLPGAPSLVLLRLGATTGTSAKSRRLGRGCRPKPTLLKIVNSLFAPIDQDTFQRPHIAAHSEPEQVFCVPCADDPNQTNRDSYSAVMCMIYPKWNVAQRSRDHPCVSDE